MLASSQQALNRPQPTCLYHDEMKIKIKSFDAVAVWKWNIKPGKENAAGTGDQEEEEEEDDVCGICQNAFEGCCPNCKVPGDDCPLSELLRMAIRNVQADEMAVFGECTHIVSKSRLRLNKSNLTAILIVVPHALPSHLAERGTRFRNTGQKPARLPR